MKFCVIGAGRFGYQVATALADNGMEVLAVDSNESIIASIRDKVSQAICLQVNDADALRSIGVEDMDVVIVAMGENFAQSILVTAILKHKLNVKMVITRSISEIHRDILQLIGANQVILPEQEVARQLADTLSLPFKAVIRITPTFSIIQLTVPKKYVGKTIKQFESGYNSAVRCLGKKAGDDFITVNDSSIIAPDDILLIASDNREIEKILKL